MKRFSLKPLTMNVQKSTYFSTLPFLCASATTTLSVSGHHVSDRLPQEGALFGLPRASELYTILQASYVARFAKMSHAAAI